LRYALAVLAALLLAGLCMGGTPAAKVAVTHATVRARVNAVPDIPNDFAQPQGVAQDVATATDGPLVLEFWSTPGCAPCEKFVKDWKTGKFAFAVVGKGAHENAAHPRFRWKVGQDYYTLTGYAGVPWLIEALKKTGVSESAVNEVNPWRQPRPAYAAAPLDATSVLLKILSAGECSFSTQKTDLDVGPAVLHVPSGLSATVANRNGGGLTIRPKGLSATGRVSVLSVRANIESFDLMPDGSVYAMAVKWPIRKRIRVSLHEAE